MAQLRHIVLNVLLVWIAPCQSGMTPSLEDTIRAVLPDVCPQNNVCHLDGPEVLDRRFNEYVEAEVTPCCTACSCLETCSIDGNCCYPADARPVSRDRQSCVYLRTPTPDNTHLFRTFYVYESCDPTYDMPGGQSTIADKMAPWGEFYPVHSPSSGRLYKNRTIAACNGIIDASELMARIFCNQDMSMNVAVGDLKNMFYGGACFVNFGIKSGRQSDLRTEMCFQELVSECPDLNDSHQPVNISMTWTDIVQACSSGLVSPYRTIANDASEFLYANVFCYICNMPHQGVNTDLCGVLDLLPNHTRTGNSNRPKFSYILTPEVLLADRKEATREICTRGSNSMDNPNNCRPVFCPMAQARHPSGQCEFVLEEVHLENVELLLQLDPVNPEDASYLQTTPVERNTITPLDGPWDEWEMLSIFCEFNVTDGKSFLTVFVLKLKLTRKVWQSLDFYESIRANLGKLYVWNINGRSISFTQSLMKRPFFERFSSPNHTFRRLYKTVADDIFDSNGSNVTISWDITLTLFDDFSVFDPFAKAAPEPYQVTKLTFCEQIELREGEFTLVSDYFLLNTINNKMLFPREFAEIRVNDAVRFRVCISDSGLTTYVMSSTIAPCGSIYILLFYLSLWLVIWNAEALPDG